MGGKRASEPRKLAVLGKVACHDLIAVETDPARSLMAIGPCPLALRQGTSATIRRPAA